MILFLISCVMHKTNLVGVLDHANADSCAIELSTGEMIQIKSSICKKAKEGDTITFYGVK